jgi:hypothetical protein
MEHREIVRWLCEERAAALEDLWRLADAVRRDSVGDEVHLRGLVEISNPKFHGRREGITLIPRDIKRNSLSGYWQQIQQLVSPGLDRCEIRHLLEHQAHFLRFKPVGDSTSRGQLSH